MIVLAPKSVSEIANFPRLCYDLAFKYRIPTMILADGIIGQMMEPLEFDFEPVDPKSFGASQMGAARQRRCRKTKSQLL